MFYINSIILLVMLLCQVYVLKNMDSKFFNIKEALVLSEDREFFRLCTDTYQFSILKVLLSVAFVFMYILSMYKVGCIDYSVSGIYGGVFGAIVFFVGIHAYIKFFGLLRFVSGFGSRDNNEIVSKIRETVSYTGKWFFALGLLYCFIYYINIPKNIVSAGIPFLIATWVGIVVFFGFGLVIAAIVNRKCLHRMAV